MAKRKKFSNWQKVPEKANVGPNNAHPNPRKRDGNPTKGGKIFGNWHKPKLK